ncbi:hypothetical protein ACQ4M3_12990 [Leptolyngbya sp. AN03gr2]|uniref:hypothetical protein n=1 Tax=unclassified Leptolyngbya TaxID=2650499 RepID=UPI003D31233F
MNHLPLSLPELELVRRSMREVLVGIANRMKYNLTDEAADLLYLEASELIQFAHAPCTVMHVALCLLDYRVLQDETGMLEFMTQIKSCQHVTDVEKTVKAILE